ncbi:hypothetical protein JCM10213_008270 [Rhodosporidiobolus nylandii]
MASQLGLYRSYAALLLGALGPIYAGAHESVKMPKAARRKLRELRGGKGKTAAEDPEDEEDDDEVERLTREDAYWFPVLGSVVLFSLFLAFKFLPKIWINRVLGAYMALMAVAGLVRSGVRVVKALGGDRGRWAKWKLALTKNGCDEGHLSFTSLHLLVLPFAILLSGAQLYTGNWACSNVVALSFSFNAISLLYIDSFATGSVLLAGLFVYDIWWVFGSKAVFGSGADVMVSVATSFEAPIKLLVPKDLSWDKPAADFSLLGLGDIVLPGIFLALALRFDYFLALKRSSAPFHPQDGFQKPYFWTCFGAYIAGLVTTIFVMHTFRAAQPALLYLSPDCIGSVVLCALVRGETKELWRYVDGEEDEEKAVGDGKGEEKEDEGKKEK